MEFILNNLLIILLVLGALFLFGFVVRSLKTILFTGIIIVILGLLGFFGDDFNQKAKETLDSAATYSQETAIPLIKSSLATAEFSYDKQTGNYIVGTEKFQVKGIEGSNQGELTIGNTTTPLDVSFMSDYIRENIAKSTASQ